MFCVNRHAERSASCLDEAAIERPGEGSDRRAALRRRIRRLVGLAATAVVATMCLTGVAPVSADMNGSNPYVFAGASAAFSCDASTHTITGFTGISAAIGGQSLGDYVYAYSYSTRSWTLLRSRWGYQGPVTQLQDSFQTVLPSGNYYIGVYWYYYSSGWHYLWDTSFKYDQYGRPGQMYNLSYTSSYCTL